MLMLLSILLPVAAGLLLFRVDPSGERKRQYWVMAGACLTAVLALLAVTEPGGGDTITLLTLSHRLDLTLALRVDGLSALFGGMVALLWPVACLYGLEYMSREKRQNRFFALYLAAFGATLGVAFSANFLTMYLFYELLTLATLPLVMHELDGKARYAGKIYLLYSMSGAALGFIAVVFLVHFGTNAFLFGGSILPGAMDEELLRLVYVLGFFGFGVKAAVFPGHMWLLRASVAPTPVTALLHAVAVVKAGVFAVVRLTWYGFGPSLLADSWAQRVVMAAAIITIVLGSAKALGTHHLKRRLAWSTVSNLSYILLGVTTMTVGGLVAGLAHMVFHAVLKMTLFGCVGAVHYKLHRDDLEGIEGCGALMPVVFGCFTVASLGLMGVPPLAGFSSKWLLAGSLVELADPLAYLGVGALVLSALLTALYLMSVVLMALFPRQNRQIARSIPRRARRDPELRMRAPLILLTISSLVLAVLAKPFTDLIARLVLPNLHI